MKLTCIYCGQPIPAGLTCPAHRDLLRVDPMRHPVLSVKTEPKDWRPPR